jgi:Cupin
MDAGVAQENGADQDLTFKVNPGEVVVVPKGLLHHNHNAQCTPNVFLQTFTSSDPGALNGIGAIAAMGIGGDAGKAAIAASGAELVEATPEGAFALDQACLKRCGFPETGAPGDGLGELPTSFKVLFGLAPPPAQGETARGGVRGVAGSFAHMNRAGISACIAAMATLVLLTLL